MTAVDHDDPQAALKTPSGCADCGIPQHIHGLDNGVHRYQRPTDTQVLARMLARRNRRAARTGALGPVLKALHDTADLMERQAAARRPAVAMDGHYVAHLSDTVCLGLTDMNQWSAMWRERRHRDGYAQARAWLDACHKVQDEVRAVLFPGGLGQNAPYYTAAQVRAVADRLAVEAKPTSEHGTTTA